LFFGASGDLNTNRQAKRLVDLSHKTNAKEVKFIVIDVDHATTDDAKKLIKTYYQGYIPCQVILDKNGKKTWSQVGEVEQGVVKNQLSKVE
jgi:short-subunit dehydrogenase